MPCVLLLLLCLTVVPARALRFSVGSSGNRRVLYIHDCFKGEGEPCQPYEEEFTTSEKGYPGDAAVFQAVLGKNRVDEIWLNSNGGQVYAALEMAPILRASHLPIRVPGPQTLLQARLPVKAYPEVRCVSSCTVLFMGGYLRSIDPEATYEVHSASGFQGLVDWQTYTITDPRIDQIAAHPEKELRDFAADEQVGARFRALAFLRLFQTTLLIPTGKPSLDESLEQIELEADRDRPPLVYGKENNPELEADKRRIDAEGRAAVQDILMRLEREFMADAIHELEQRSDLGPRSAPALEMVRLMYMESIRETSTLSQSELLRRGYVTPPMP